MRMTNGTWKNGASMPTHIEQELGIAPATNRVRRWFRRFLPSGDRSLDPLTVNYEVWRAIQKNVRRWPTYREAPNYIEVLVSPEDWADYWGVDTVRKEAGVSAYVRSRIVEKGLWVAGEPQILVFEDDTIEMGEIDISCQFVEPMSSDEIETLRSSIGREAPYAARTNSPSTHGYSNLPSGDLGATVDYAYDESLHANVEVVPAVPVKGVVNVLPERVENVEPVSDEPQEHVDMQVPEFLAAAAKELDDAEVAISNLSEPEFATVDAATDGYFGDDEEQDVSFEVAEEETARGDAADEPEDEPEPDQAPEQALEPEQEPEAAGTDESDRKEDSERAEGPVPPGEEAPEQGADLGAGQDSEPAPESVAEQASMAGARVNVRHVIDLPPIPEPAPRPGASMREDGVDVELSGLSSQGLGMSQKPTPTIRFVDEGNPGSLYLVGDEAFRLEIHSGDCIGAVRLGDSVPAQVNIRLDADGFPYAETMQCSIVVDAGRWCVINHAVHGTRLTKASGARYLLGRSDPCPLDQGDLLWLGHERPLRVEY